MWGSSDIPLKQFFQKISEAGFDGVEMNIPYDQDYSLQVKTLLKEFGLILIAQQWLPPAEETVDGYIARMKTYLQHLASFQPLLINSHTGKDFFSFEENCLIFEEANNFCKNEGVKIVHETHRGRALFSTYSAKQYFSRFPDLRINADFSHWCCVSESLLQDQNEIIELAIQRTDYIHARVGHEQGPQVNHLLAEENSKTLNAHLEWWQRIIEKAKLNEKEEIAICTEFGPEPYLQTFPFTNKPVTEQWELNRIMKHLLQEKFKG